MTPSTPSQASRPGMAPAAQAPARSGGFMSGLAGGLIGAGIGAMIFGGGGGFFGHGLGFGGFLGFLLQIGIVATIGWLMWRWFANRRQPAMAGGPNMLGRDNMARDGMAPRDMAPREAAGMSPGMMPGGGAMNAAPPVAIGPNDFQQFEQLLIAMQAAWSARDLNALRGMATPEMVSYFADQLAAQSSRGVVNTVTDVRLDSGDLSEAWAEQGRDYATVAMRFSMIDVTKDGSGRVVDGSATERASATELWTFLRSRGGQWILSAIQQTR